MPRAKQRCRVDCSNVKGECPIHRPARIPWENSKRKDSGFLDSQKWKLQRRRVLKRDKYFCQLCGASDSRHVDHIIPVYYTKKEDVSDDELQTLCSKCHQAKSSFEGVQAKRIKKAGNGTL